MKLPMWQKVVLLVVVIWVMDELLNLGIRDMIMSRREGMCGQNHDDGLEGFKSNTTLQCTMYYTEWCPHCKSAKPEWNKLMNEFNGKNVNGKKILITKIDCEKYPELAKKQNIEGYPTFKFVLDGSELEYTGGRSYLEFKRFIQSVV